MTDESRASSDSLLSLFGLLQAAGLDPDKVRVARHTPKEPMLAAVMPWLVNEHPDLFRVYQQLQGKSVEQSFKKADFIVSFLPHKSEGAIFAGVFENRGHAPISFDDFWSIPQNGRLGELGYDGMDRSRVPNFFDLRETPYLSQWKGRLIISWEPGRSWVRIVRRSNFPVEAILPESAFTPDMPHWDELDLSWTELSVLPVSWQTRLSQWRGIYYIFDMELKLGYVGMAAGEENLLGRWRNYATSGHGGNVKLRASSANNLRFSILQLVSPTLPRTELETVEAGWKRRLHTRAPQGLNAN